MTLLADGPTRSARAGSDRRRLLAPPLALAGVAAAGVGVLAWWDPHTHHVPLCPIHAVTGVWCPLCGGLRAVSDLIAGHWTAALHDNVLAVILLPMIAAWWCAWLLRARAGRRGGPSFPMAADRRRLVWLTAFCVVVLYTVLRNLPVGAFLAPAS